MKHKNKKKCTAHEPTLLTNYIQVCGYVGFTAEMEHKIIAGADILLMPSRYEPCGLPQVWLFSSFCSFVLSNALQLRTLWLCVFVCCVCVCVCVLSCANALPQPSVFVCCVCVCVCVLSCANALPQPTMWPPPNVRAALWHDTAGACNGG
jgi:hypothetical protein